METLDDVVGGICELPDLARKARKATRHEGVPE